ncbi:MAG TPA: type II CAAX endopeptidase family protein [Thermoanaerobaculia bacterium]|nr:type II CAAX endopeptidase family protein [Thermoanaerobaculia bacterium]
MTHFAIPLLLVAIVYAVMLVLNERMGLFGDHFSSPLLKVLAYIWLAIFLGVITVAIVSSSLVQPTAKQLSAMPFYSLFALHAILIVFLAGWWFLTGRPPITRFLNIRLDGNSLLTGLAVGVGGWMFTIALALAVALVLQATGVIPKDVQPPAMIGWIATLPVWKKCVLVLSAMTVEEAFFRGWLQKRIGLIASTLFFALAHAGYGQPFLLIGVALISLVIGFTFYRTKNIIPGVIAHGVFDAVQLFVIIPIAFKATGLGG